MEDGCVVLEALYNGVLEEEMLKNYHKMRREAQHYEASAAEKSHTDKTLGKTYKAIQNLKRKKLLKMDLKLNAKIKGQLRIINHGIRNRQEKRETYQSSNITNLL